MGPLGLGTEPDRPVVIDIEIADVVLQGGNHAARVLDLVGLQDVAVLLDVKIGDDILVGRRQIFLKYPFHCQFPYLK